MKNTDVVILTGGVIAADISSVFGKIPSGMIPINGKPAISFILDELISQRFSNFYIATGYKKKSVESFVSRKYRDKCTLHYVHVDSRLGPGNSLLSVLNHVESDDLLIFLGDTIVMKELTLNDDFVLTSKDFEDPQKWCLVKTDERGNIQDLFDKKKILNTDEDLQALIGVYYLKNKSILKSISSTVDNRKKIEISEIINKYKDAQSIKCIECDRWIDLGHLDKYYRAKVQLIQSRYFNKLKFEPLVSVITKESTDEEKLKNEIKWYLNLPKQLSLLASRLVDYDLGNKPFMKLEYYGYPTLSELFLYGELHYNVWKTIIDKLVGILNLMRLYKGEVSLTEYRFMYLTKTFDRLAAIDDPDFKRILSYNTISLNGEQLYNIDKLIPFIETFVENLYKKSQQNNCVIHGDFCLSNILYDVHSGIVRLIDPRGVWGDSFYGDIRYDVAKLRHSISGKYDFITNDLFALKHDGDSFKFNVFSSRLYKKIEEFFDSKICVFWDIDEIKFIEGLLFCSMIPLHKDAKIRQLAMYCTGLKLLNEVFQKRYFRCN